MDLKNRNVCIIGAGKSGMGSVELLSRLGARIVIYDSNPKLTAAEVEKRLPEGTGARVVIGKFEDELLAKVDLFVISPGVPLDIPEVKRIKDSNAMLIGEIELAYMFEKGQVLGITGTNGKTTTTSLVGHICRNYFDKTFVVGNIGEPYTSVVLDSSIDSVTVAELSSFQLESISTFHPSVSAILNITPDHLNRHHTMEEYIKAKENILINQDIMDYCVLNFDDMILRKLGMDLEEEMKCNVTYFSSKTVLEHGAYLENGSIYFDDGFNKDKICDVKDLNLVGMHNYENVMAAVAMSISAGVPVDVCKESILTFKPVEHRMEFVRNVKGVDYYNDSKGTNPDAAIKAVEAIDDNILLIAGGYDKDSDYTSWIKSFKDKTKLLVLMGATKDKIASAAIDLGFDKNKIVFVETFKEGVNKCIESAVKGDTVLLSPACASWGMFDNYEQRGDLFKEIVNNI